jgi:hypothetical protein
MYFPKFAILFIVILVCFLSGCGQKTDEPVIEVVDEDVEMDIESSGEVSGRILYLGEVPERKELPFRGNPECSGIIHDPILSEALLVQDGGVQNAFVYVKEGLEDFDFPIPKRAVPIDNVGCVYKPHVAGVQVNQPIKIINSDPAFHNFHAVAKNQSGWNIGLPFQGMSRIKTFKVPEVMVKLKCDLHPWMIGYLGVLSHPYYSVSKEDGTFSIPNLPPGGYVLEVWHETLGIKPVEVTIGADEVKKVEVTFE